MLTVTAVLLVGAVTGIATWQADRGAPVRTAPVPAASAAPLPGGAREDRISFGSARGAGQLTLLRRSWNPPGAQPSVGFAFLLLEVELMCREGEVDYSPYAFQAFDESGGLYDVAVSDSVAPGLGTGTLRPGESVRGFLAFDIPRGEVTLLMSVEDSQAVTALRVPS